MTDADDDPELAALVRRKRRPDVPPTPEEAAETARRIAELRRKPEPKLPEGWVNPFIGATAAVVRDGDPLPDDVDSVTMPKIVPPKKAPPTLEDLACKSGAIRASSLIGEIRAKSTLPVVMTPWNMFNAATEGLELGSITLAVGYQGSGKSSQAAQLAAHHARSGPVIYYLGEMGARVFVARVVGQQLKRSWRDVLRGKVTDEEMHRVLDELDLRIIPAKRRPEDVVDAITLELDAIAAAKTKGTPLLVVDYVQLLTLAGPDMRQAMIAAVRGIQDITETRGIVTWMLSQGSRPSAKRIREGAKDSIDLADTGAETAELERSATIQFALSYQQHDDTPVHEITMAVGKRRFGGPTKLYFDYDGVTGLFTDRAVKVVSEVERARRDEILAQVDAHHDQVDPCRCLGDLSANAFCKAGGKHKVTGDRGKVVLPRLAAMVKDGEIHVRGGDYRRGRRS